MRILFLFLCSVSLPALGFATGIPRIDFDGKKVAVDQVKLDGNMLVAKVPFCAKLKRASNQIVCVERGIKLLTKKPSGQEQVCVSRQSQHGYGFEKEKKCLKMETRNYDTQLSYEIFRNMFEKGPFYLGVAQDPISTITQTYKMN